MPNNVYNHLIIEGDQEILEKFYFENKKKENIDKEENEEILCFSNLVPIDEDNWYEESIQKWSTKWEPYDITVSEEYSNNKLEYEFNTAWSPPHNWLLSVSKIYTELEFSIYSEDEFINFFCEDKYIDGNHTNLYEYDCNHIIDYMKDYLKLNPIEIYNYLLLNDYDIKKLFNFIEKKKVNYNEDNNEDDNEFNLEDEDSELYEILGEYCSENNLLKMHLVQDKVFKYLIDWIIENNNILKNLQSYFRVIFAKRILFRHKLSKELSVMPPLSNGYPGGKEYHEGLIIFNELYKNKFT